MTKQKDVAMTGLVGLIGIAKAADLNPSVVPIDVPITISPGISKWLPLWCCVGNQSANGQARVFFDLWTGPNATGQCLDYPSGGLVASTTGFTILQQLGQPLTPPSLPGPLTATTVYINIVRGDGAPLTADIWIIGQDLTSV